MHRILVALFLAAIVMGYTGGASQAQSCQRDALSGILGGNTSYTCSSGSMFETNPQRFTVPADSGRGGIFLPSPERSSCGGGSFLATCDNGSRTMTCYGRDNCSLDR